MCGAYGVQPSLLFTFEKRCILFPWVRTCSSEVGVRVAGGCRGYGSSIYISAGWKGGGRGEDRHLRPLLRELTFLEVVVWNIGIKVERLVRVLTMSPICSCEIN